MEGTPENEKKAIVGESSLNDLLSEYFEKTHNDLPGLCWMIESGTFLHLEFMSLGDEGCWAILSARSSGEETGRINVGVYKTMEEIRTLIKALKQGR